MMETVGSELCFPHLLNTSCKKPNRSYVETIFIYILLSFLSLLTVFLNLLVIISISHFRKLHSPTNLLLLSLAVADFFVGFLMCFHIIFINGCSFFGDLLCTLYQYLAYVITSASVGNMVLIAVDRYVAICDPMHYTSKVTQKRVQICICVSWICAILFQSLSLQDILKQPGKYNTCIGECVMVVDYIVGLIDVVVSFLAPITIIVVLYMRVFVVALSQARAMRSHITGVTTNGSLTTTAKKSELKAARTLGVVVIVFIMCLCPYYCVALSGSENYLKVSSSTFVIIWFYFNSCLNPVIYALFYPWFRKSIELIVTLKILQPDSCETAMM